MKRAMLYLLLIVFPMTAFAGEKVKGTDFFVVEEQNWETGNDTGFWIWQGKGVSRPHSGPFESEPIQCYGSGFWDKDNSWGEGICLHGSGDDTRTTSWQKGKDEKVGRWKILIGTGKFEGATGQGTYKPVPLAGEFHLAEIEGEVTLAE